MTTLVVPPLDDDPWPTLGPAVCDFIETNLIFGPGDLRGKQAVIDDETRGLIYRAYEVYPRGHEQEGRRRFKRVAFSLRKGTAKTEKAAWLAACEVHPDAPVRCDGFRRSGRSWVPVGRPVSDPYIPMVAYTEEQTEDLAYGALYVILSEGPLADDFDIGLEQIRVLGPTGKARGEVKALAAAPNGRDGARTTFQHFDETHRMTLRRLRDAHQTMLANIPKRFLADAWSLETTTAPEPGTKSVAEATMDYADLVDGGSVADPRLFFFHRQASDDHDLTTEAGARAAVIEASGPAAAWSDIDGIMSLWSDPQTDRAYWERVWTNRKVQAETQAFDPLRWAELSLLVEGKPPPRPANGELVVAGFDGARFEDSTALIGTDVVTGDQWVQGIWEKQPTDSDDWEVDATEVDLAVEDLFENWQVWRLYADPPFWETNVDAWAGRWPKRVVRWWTNRQKPMAYALRGYRDAQRAGEVHHDGDPRLARHIANARKHVLAIRDDQGRPLYTIRKDRPDSPNKIDASMAGCLSWEARGDAIAAGAKKRRGGFHSY